MLFLQLIWKYIKMKELFAPFLVKNLSGTPEWTIFESRWYFQTSKISICESNKFN